MPTKHITGTTQALYRVFVSPALQQRTSARPLLHPKINPRNCTLRQTFSTAHPRQAKTRAPEVRTEKWDEEITSRLVYIVDEETNKILGQPRTRYDVLRRINRDTHRLVQVAENISSAPEGDADEAGGYRPFGHQDGTTQEGNIPVCKIIGKKEHHKRMERRKADAKEKRRISAVSSSVKTLELNWAIDANDLSHRLNRVQEFLAEGRKVEIVLAAKKKGRKASPEECKGLLKKLQGTVEAVNGAKEERPMEGKLGAFTTLYLAGKPTKTATKEPS